MEKRTKRTTTTRPEADLTAHHMARNWDEAYAIAKTHGFSAEMVYRSLAVYADQPSYLYSYAATKLGHYGHPRLTVRIETPGAPTEGN
jgi:hypothetical protein